MLAIGFKVKNTVSEAGGNYNFTNCMDIQQRNCCICVFFFLKCHLDFGVSLQTAKVKRSFSLSHEHKLWSLSLTFTVLQPFTCPTESDILLSCLVLVFSFLSNLSFLNQIVKLLEANIKVGGQWQRLVEHDGRLVERQENKRMAGKIDVDVLYMTDMLQNSV